jgi:DNA-nicking Smr family endonuclease
MAEDEPVIPDPDTPVPLPVTESLDLHAFQPRQIPDLVANYLHEAAAQGLREVRIVHGKGIGFQRERVRRILATHPRVEWFTDAPVERGHWGATLVRLRLD